MIFKLARRAVQFIFLLWLGVLIVTCSFQESFIFPAPQHATQVDTPPGFEPVSIDTPDGEKLAAFASVRNADPPTIILFHGNGDLAAWHGPRAAALADAGYSVVLAEYRGYGQSTGEPSEKGLVQDALATYDFVRKQSSAPIAVLGYSLGAGVAVHLAAQRNVDALVLEAPFDSLFAVAQSRLPYLPVSYFLRHPFRSDELISNIRSPLYIVHGTRDRVIPINHGRRLHSLAPKGAVFEALQGAGHNLFADHMHLLKVIDFFDQALGR